MKSFLIILLIACSLMCPALPSVAWGQEKRPAVSQRQTMNAGLPYVSPDGSHIAFVSDRDGADLFVISANGTGKVQLRHTPEYESPAGWTRDSKHILFSVYANLKVAKRKTNRSRPRSQQAVERSGGDKSPTIVSRIFTCRLQQAENSMGNSLQADKHNPKGNLRVVVLGKRQTEK